MGTRFEPVADAAALERVMARSRGEDVVLFLHDPFCPVSALAHREVEQLEGEVALVDVARQRGMSQAVEERTGVRHESPQAIVLRGGRAAWHASHRGITAAAIRRALGTGEAPGTATDAATDDPAGTAA